MDSVGDSGAPTAVMRPKTPPTAFEFQFSVLLATSSDCTVVSATTYNVVPAALIAGVEITPPSEKYCWKRTAPEEGFSANSVLPALEVHAYTVPSGPTAGAAGNVADLIDVV